MSSEDPGQQTSPEKQRVADLSACFRFLKEDTQSLLSENTNAAPYRQESQTASPTNLLSERKSQRALAMYNPFTQNEELPEYTGGALITIPRLSSHELYSPLGKRESLEQIFKPQRLCKVGFDFPELVHEGSIDIRKKDRLESPSSKDSMHFIDYSIRAMNQGLGVMGMSDTTASYEQKELDQKLRRFRKMIFQHKPKGEPDAGCVAYPGYKACSCKSSKCLKLYCECFKSGRPCLDLCKCQGCRNRSCPQGKAPKSQNSNPSPSDQMRPSVATQDLAVSQTPAGE